MIIVALVVIWWLTGLTGLIFGESTFLLVQVDHLRFFGEEEGSITRSKQEFNQMIDTKPCPSKNGKGISSSSDLKMVESGKDTFFATELVNFGQGWKPIVNLAVPQRTRNSNKMTTLQIIPFAISVGPTFRPSSWLFLPLFFFESPPFPWNQWRTTNPPRHWNRYPSLWSRLPSVHYLGRLQPSENDFLSVFARILMDKRWTFSSHVKKQKKQKTTGFRFRGTQSHHPTGIWSSSWVKDDQDEFATLHAPSL